MVSKSSASWASSDGSRRSMQGNKGSGTTLELRVRSLVHSRGLRYRVNHRPEKALRRTADLVFTRARVVVMLDGCYWHRCPEHATWPKRNPDWWEAKFRRTIERDAETNRLLEGAGWTVLRFWEHDEPELIADQIEKAVRAPH